MTAEQKVLYENKLFLVAFKPHGLPTVPLKSGPDSDSLLSRVGAEVPAVLHRMSDKPWEGGTVHRLDTDTAGLVLFAKTPGFFSYISGLQKNNGFLKRYIARCIRIQPDAESLDRERIPDRINTYFRAYGPGRKKVRPETDIRRSDNGIMYETVIEHVDKCNREYEFTVSILRGFRHQIRAHLAYIGYPIVGDRLYNPDKQEVAKAAKAEKAESCLQLLCTGLRFPLPSGEMFTYTLCKTQNSWKNERGFK